MILSEMRFSRRVVPTLLVLSLMAGSFLPKETASASGKYQTDCKHSTSWREYQTESFAIVYPTQYEILAQTVLSSYGDSLDEELINFSGAFGEGLVTPISIRLYTSSLEYYCLNALAPPLGVGATHSHIGSREIALIADSITNNLSQWHSQALNGFRHELVVLFAEYISQGNAPPGLLYGIGGYAENPNETFEARFQAAGSINEPDINWQVLWDGDYLLSDESAHLQVTSTVAYLIDVYGWNAFVSFLQNLFISESYRQALVNTYGSGIQDLQAHWREYFRVYVVGRWRANVFHSFDLTVIDEMLTAGAYADAVEDLQEAIPLIESFGEEEELLQAQDLLTKAQSGIEAGALTSHTRQKLLEGEFEKSIELSNQALSLYGQLGDDRRLAELETYLVLAQEVIQLRGEIEAVMDSRKDLTVTRRLYQIGQRLNELGDHDGVSLVNIALTDASAAQSSLIEGIVAVGFVIILLLLWWRFRALWQTIPPEADLL